MNYVGICPDFKTLNYIAPERQLFQLDQIQTFLKWFQLDTNISDYKLTNCFKGQIDMIGKAYSALFNTLCDSTYTWWNKSVNIWA